MGVLRGPDFFYSLRFLRLLTMPWEKTAAFKAGIINKNGQKLKKPETPDEKSAYNVFHKLVFNIRRLLAKAPGGSSAIAKYATALFLIKDHLQLSDKSISKVIKEHIGVELEGITLDEQSNAWYLTEDKKKIQSSKYALTRDIALPKTGDMLAKKGSWVSITEHEPVGSIFNIPVFEALHLKTNQSLYVIQEDLIR
jgi:hypothetical protein